MYRELPVNLQTLVDSHDLPYQVIDRERRVVAVNQAFLQCFGLRRSDAVGQACYRINYGREHPCTYYGDDCPHARVFADRQRSSQLRDNTCRGALPFRQIAIPLPMEDGTLLMGKSLTPELRNVNSPQVPVPDSISEYEHRQIRHYLLAFNGNRRRVAERLGISERTLYRRLKQYEIS